MTNFITTLTAAALITVAASAPTHAADDTFAVTIEQDRTASAEANYLSMQTQARAACEASAIEGGFRKTKLPTYLVRRCEKDILAKIVKASSDPVLTFVHNETWGTKLKTRAFAQK